MDSHDGFKSGKFLVKALALVVVSLAFGAAIFWITSILKFKLTLKVVISVLVAIASFIGIVGNIEDFLSFIERIFGIELRPKPHRDKERRLERRLRVLTVMPRPLDARPLTHLTDPEKFVEVFRKINAPVDIDFVRPPTFKEFRRALRNGYDIVHFDGHGSPEALAFETEDCLMDDVPVEDFAEAVKSVDGRRPKLIVLSACSAAKGKRSFAKRLHKLTKAAVIGFSEDVDVYETEIFSERLYEELGSGKKLGDAFDSAVNALRRESPEAAEFAKLFGKRSLRLVQPGSKGEVKVEVMDWFKVPNPLQTDVFVGVMTKGGTRKGRGDILHDIIVDLSEERRKLVLLYGDGGFGKTALAYEAARRLAPHYIGGVLWFDGRGKMKISLDTFLTEAFRWVLGEEFTKLDPEGKKAYAYQFLHSQSQRHKPVLIVADNIDFAEKAVWDFLLYLPERCASIATSRDRPHDVPVAGHHIGRMLYEEAKSMLFLISGRLLDDEAASEIFERTGGMPAAIEFAARDIRDQMVGLDETLENLRRWPSKGMESRFDFTYEPLHDELKRFLWLISLFPAGIQPEFHLKLMCEKFSEEEQPPFGERWQRLWDKLIGRRQWVRPSELKGYYEMNPVVRDYIRRKAKKADPEVFDSFERRFVRIMVLIAEALRSQLQAEKAALFVLGAAVEHDNLLGAQRTAREKGMWQEVLDLAYALDRLFTRSGHWSDRWEVLKSGLEAAQELGKRWDEGAMLNSLGNLAAQQGRYDEAKKYYEGALKIAKELGQKAEMAATLTGLGSLAYVQGRYDEAKGYYERSLEIKQELGDRAGVASALTGLGILAAQQGRYDEAKGYYERSLSISEELGDRAGVALTLTNLGNLAYVQGRYDEAKGYFERSLSISEELGDRAGVARTLGNLGNLAYVQGRYDEAKGYYEKSLSISEELGDRAGVARTLINLGICAAQQGRYDEAKGYYEKSLRISEVLGDRAGVASTLGNLGTLAMDQGRYDEAKGYFEHALKVFEELGQKAEVATTLNNLGNLAMDQGRYGEAKGYYEKSLSIREEIGDRAGVASTLTNLGILAAQQDRYGEAKDYFEDALKVFDELGRKAEAATILNNLGNLAMDQGRYDKAKGYYEKSLSISEEFGDRAGMASTLTNLGALADDLNKPELAFRFTAIALSLFKSMKHADAQKAGRNLVRYAQKLGYDEKKLDAERNKIAQEFEQRGFELVDELLRELDEAIDARKG